MTHSKGNGGASAAQDRLQSLEKTSDGFALAQMDLRLRHEGEILGYRQHGGVTLRFVDLDATRILSNGPIWTRSSSCGMLATLTPWRRAPCATRSPCVIDISLRRSAEDENHRR